jgi:transposase
MAKTTRTRQQRERDKNILVELYVKGYPQHEIAKRLGVSAGQVSSDWNKLIREWEETRFAELDRYRHEQLKRIDMIEREMWAAWELSKTLKKTSSTKSKSGEFVTKKDKKKNISPATAFIAGIGVGDDDDDLPKVSEEKYWRASVTEEDPTGGDMQFMNGIMWCVSERTKLLGLAVKKIAQTNPEGDKEAGSGIRDELMALLDDVTKHAEIGAAQSAKLLEEGEAQENIIDAEVEYHPDYEIARQIKAERIKRLPAPQDGTVEAEVEKTQEVVYDGIEDL